MKKKMRDPINLQKVVGKNVSLLFVSLRLFIPHIVTEFFRKVRLPFCRLLHELLATPRYHGVGINDLIKISNHM